jgi:hypothetical protein
MAMFLYPDEAARLTAFRPGASPDSGSYLAPEAPALYVRAPNERPGAVVCSLIHHQSLRVLQQREAFRSLHILHLSDVAQGCVGALPSRVNEPELSVHMDDNIIPDADPPHSQVGLLSDANDDDKRRNL